MKLPSDHLTAENPQTDKILNPTLNMGPAFNYETAKLCKYLRAFIIISE